MKKLSFFLMAMLFSVMSFAQEAIYTLDGTITGGTSAYAEASSITQDNIAWSVTGNTTMNPWRIGGKNITNQDRAVYSKNPIAYNIDKIELTHGTASSITVNSLKLIISDAANGAGETIDVTFKASATTTIDLPEGDYTNKYFKFLYNVTVSGTSNKYVQFKSAKFYAALAEDAVKAPVIKGAEDFISETEIAIEAEDDVTVYYTVDGTEPTTASTVYTAPFTVKETTTVKAVAYRGEKASFVTSATFTKATQLTCAEAAVEAMKVASNNATTNITYVVYGYVTELDGGLSSGQQKFWVSDTKGGENTFYSYFCNVPRALVVGDYIQMFGKLTKYNTTPQMKNGDITILPAPVAKFNVTVTAENGTVEGAGEYEENAEATLTATANEGYEFTCWTSGEDTVSTANPYTFAVTANVALVANFKEVVKAIEVNVTGATATASGQNIDINAQWNEQSMLIMLWQGGATQGFGTYAAEDYGPIMLGGGMKELTPTTEGVYADNGDGTFTFTCSATDGTTQYNITVTGNNPTQGGGDEEYPIIDDAITNLTFNLDEEPYSCMGGPSEAYGIELYLVLGEEDGMGTFTLTEASEIYVQGSPATFISGYLTDIDTSAPAANAVIVAKLPDGSTFEFHIAMSSTPVDATVIVVENATLAIDSTFLFNNPVSGDVYEYSLTMSGNWTDSTNTTYLVTVKFPVYDPATTEEQERLANIKVGDFAADDAPFLGMVEDFLTITNVNGVITAKGLVSGNGLAFDITISGSLAQDPETGVDNINTTVAPVKVIENGQIFIISNGVKYNAQGAQL